MKNNLIGSGMLIGVVGIAIYFAITSESSVEYHNNDTATTTVVETVEPDWASDPDARAAAEAVVHKKKLEAELATLETEVAERQNRIDEIEKELGTYWKRKANVKALIREHFPEAPSRAIAIATCESGLKQWKADGSVVRGIVDKDDTGLFQINNRYWKDDAIRLGLDYENNIEDNVRMARHIYDTQGVTAWVCYTKNMHLAYL